MKLKKAINLTLIAVVVFIVLGIAYYYYGQFSSRRINTKMEISQAHPALKIDTTQRFPAENQYCLTCHQGIMPARPMQSKMMQEILERGKAMGDPNGCVVCHGGTPSATKDKRKAHSGVPKGSRLKAFTPVPAALQVNENTCGLCHEDHTYNAHRSLMNTDAGKMKAMEWSYGINTQDHIHRYGDHDQDDPDGMTPRFGTAAYKAYMKEMAQKFPGQYRKELKQIPQVNLDSLEMMPEHAVYAYLRNCNACHLSNKGLQDRGHFRGMGCSACHSVYNNEGMYEGNDPSISKTESGHIMMHGMQGTRKSAVVMNHSEMAGIQVSTCAACHGAGRRIGFAYQGLFAYGHGDHRGVFNEEGGSQLANAGYTYKHIQGDAHHRLSKDGRTVTGLLCQDCHLTTSMHGNGNINGAALAVVEIECADCHGTPDKYPWELPLGYGDEFGKKLDKNKPRGLADRPMEVTERFGNVYPKEDGYLLSSRGNPMGNVVRRGNKVIVHSETGYDFVAPTLKELTENNDYDHPEKAMAAMVAVPDHMEKLECYACHSTWVPQYYGYKNVMDFTKKSIDWLDSPETSYPDGTTDDYRGKFHMQHGASTNWDYSHVRWEEPVLGVNGEGRVTPLTGVIQTVSTVIGKDGKVIDWNRVAKADAGYAAIEMAPVQPHTTSKKSRECTDCHGNATAQGLGVDKGVYDAHPDEDHFADVVSSDAKNVSQFTKVQIHAIKGLHSNFQTIIKDGKQVMTVGSHWETAMPLTTEQREKLSRDGVCLSCHQDIPNGSIPIKMLGKIAEVTHLSFASDEAHSHLLRENNLIVSAIKFFGMVGGILFIPIAFFGYRWYKKRKKK